ncbi:unnamed protein product [Effrenium voratum]|nr:unnamed protein product [Effrenium voratum]|mmetsp:Transcript_126603/g.300750  ORF Transcript_126603/g.300750 Transcript_126603/m.300750 type:complete len:569 (+) Transcript_126603:43-1749(+)|eukprot:CAMPEP_0181426586 /NCGR_PEP_ID=MMETSP1110-20121109/15738_1 /TAXON_ID=174948 /ORGANISM="Symbiodinium sp., Strain CCMP421" /LENGTH=568 /DNA_ID=CAMNT_0023549783 /DNA_START=43 /DNA_END=1749 /DNA_ORIENTATION=+
MVIKLHDNVISVSQATPSAETTVPTDSTPADYPLQLGLAYLFLVGYLVRTAFLSAGLPSSVGVIVTGFVFSYFFQAELLSARDELQELSFFLVLLTAGLEIRLKDLRTFMFIMAFLPATFELLAIASYGMLVLGYTPIEGLVLGTILVAIGDGLVIPKMKEFGYIHKGHPLPRLMFTWAPLEASFALALFGALSGFASPASSSLEVGQLVAGNVLRIAVTVMGGAVLGSSAGWLITRRTSLRIRGLQVLSGTPVEAFLMVISIALCAYALGVDAGEHTLVPMPLIGGAMFQPELMVIMTGVFFSAAASQLEIHQVERVMGGVWIFGQLILFSMIGSRTTLDIFPAFWKHVFPLMACGLCARFLGIFLAINGVLQLDLPGHPFQASMVMQDTTFCFLSVLPRATIQGALGQVPITGKFFGRLPNSSGCQDFIFLAARLYICILSVVGMILLNTFGNRIILQTLERPAWGHEGQDELKKQIAQSSLESPEDSSIQDVVQTLSKAYKISESVLKSALQDAMARSCDSLPERSATQPELRRGEQSTDLAFAQFDCLGSVLREEENAWRGHQR